MESLHYLPPELVPSHHSDGAQVDLNGPMEIADRVWWVGSMHRDEVFQCHPYLIEAGSDSVLIDPGSALSIETTLERVARIVPLDHIRWIVCHHSDPDIAGGLVRLGEVIDRPDARLVTEWRAETLIRHYGHRFPVHLIEDHDWTLTLADGRTLQFVLTPYLHFPGAMCSYEASTRVLFSSDLFGGFTDGSSLFATDSSHFETIRSFHEHYMPSREILTAGLGRIRRAFPDIDLIAPQHGCVIPNDLVDEMFTRLAELECGIFLLAQQDLDVARLLRVAAALRRITDALVMAHDFPELAATTERVLPDLLPVLGIELYVETSEEGWLRFSNADHWAGTKVAGLPPHRDPNLELALPGDGTPAIAVVQLSEPADITGELTELFNRLGPALRVALDRHLDARVAGREQERLDQQSRHDALTGLYNRRELETLDPNGRRYGILMIDIDQFKGVNDQFGHDVGDEVLKRVATSITDNIRAQDIAIRQGGDEFLVLLNDADDALARQLAERIRLAIGAIDAEGLAPQGQITVSIGVAQHDAGPSLAPAIATADSVLYDAKKAGRDQVKLAI
jgi:diguanylate cyclase (GGDEF)-like protein